MNHSQYSHLRSYLIFILAIICVLNALIYFIPGPILISFALIVFIICIPSMNKLPLIMSLCMIVLGQLLFILYDGDWSIWQEAILQYLPYVALFAFVPLLSIPIRSGGYIAYIDMIMERYADRPTPFYTLISGFSAVLGSFMNVGAVHIMSDLFAQKISSNRRLMTESIIQGFSLSLFLSPYIGGVAVVLFLMDISLFPFIIWGMLLFVLGMMLIFARLYRHNNRNGEFNLAPHSQQIDPYKNNVKVENVITNNERYRMKGWQLSIAFLSLFLSVVILERLMNVNFIIIISVLALTFPIIWLVFINKLNTLSEQLIHYKNDVLPFVHNQIILIVSVSFFSQMMHLTPVSDYLSYVLVQVTEWSLILTILSILLLILLPSLLGIHALIPIIMIATNVSPEVIGLDPTLFAFVLTVGFSLAAQMSPVSALTIIAGNILSVGPFQFMKWNWEFVTLMTILASLLIYGLNLMIT